MAPDVLPKEEEQLSPALAELLDEAERYFKAAKAKNTKKAYECDWSDFRAWCKRHGRRPLPSTPETVALYLTHRARFLKVSTLGRRLSAINEVHRAVGLNPPCKAQAVRTIWAGIKREKGEAQSRKSPTLTKHIRNMVSSLPENMLGTRDRALLLLGFAGAMRRGELVGLDVSDLELTDKGLVVTIRKGKTDQTGKGRKIGVPFGSHETTCPVKAVEAWLSRSGLSDGPLFRSVNRHGQVSCTRLGDRAVALVVKRALLAAGIDPKNFAGHSLRAGFATAAAMAGAGEREIQNQTGHKSLLVLRRYIRDGSLFQDNAVYKLGI